VRIPGGAGHELTSCPQLEPSSELDGRLALHQVAPRDGPADGVTGPAVTSHRVQRRQRLRRQDGLRLGICVGQDGRTDGGGAQPADAHTELLLTAAGVLALHRDDDRLPLARVRQQLASAVQRALAVVRPVVAPVAAAGHLKDKVPVTSGQVRRRCLHARRGRRTGTKAWAGVAEASPPLPGGGPPHHDEWGAAEKRCPPDTAAPTSASCSGRR
jgi:hypothetical protein